LILNFSEGGHLSFVPTSFSAQSGISARHPASRKN
jgi:hypothetical protein